MNFFGHAVICGALVQDLEIILGSMLPDFVTMAGVRLPASLSPAIKAGIDLHHRTDSVFHRAPQFVEMMADTMDELEDAGLSRGPARATAHVGIELLLDGLLASVPSRVHTYRSALAIGNRIVDLSEAQDQSWIQSLILRLQQAPLPHGYESPEFVAGRVEYILQSRPRLRLEASHMEHVCDILHGVQDKLRTIEADLVLHLTTQVSAMNVSID